MRLKFPCCRTMRYYNNNSFSKIIYLISWHRYNLLVLIPFYIKFRFSYILRVFFLSTCEALFKLNFIWKCFLSSNFNSDAILPFFYFYWVTRVQKHRSECKPIIMIFWIYSIIDDKIFRILKTYFVKIKVIEYIFWLFEIKKWYL
jgi:hypothetical protein